MLTIDELHKQPEYWTDIIQNEIYRQVVDYMEEHDLNQNELANQLGVSKGYVSQILKGDCNFSIKKLVELFLMIDRKPIISAIPSHKLIAENYVIDAFNMTVNVTLNTELKHDFSIASNDHGNVAIWEDMNIAA